MDWKNERLSEALYQHAIEHPRRLESFGPIPPLTRRQRWAFRWEELRRRLRRAAAALAGRDDDYGC